MSMRFIVILLLFFTSQVVSAQTDNYNEISPDGSITTPESRSRKKDTDSLGTDKEIPKGIKVWTVDERFGDRRNADVDTLQHMFMNTIFTTGVYGEYNTTGNLGAPRINRIFINRHPEEQFIFTQPYDYFIKPVEKFHFTNTLSPLTNLTYNTCGDRMNGEDHFNAKFCVNASKKLGAGFTTDYIYGRGYYQEQSTSHFNFSLFGSYLGDRYQAHLLFSTNHQKVTENGGINNDYYITHPEGFSNRYQSSEIPTALASNWNRNDNQHVFFSHRYSIGFNRKVPMTPEEIEAKKFALAAKKDQLVRERAKDKDKKDSKGKDKEPSETFKGRPDDAKIVGLESALNDSLKNQERIAVQGKAALDSLVAAEKKAEEDTSWLKNEYVPVTSFIHTFKFDTYERIYDAYKTPSGYYANTYYNKGKHVGDSIYDLTRHYDIRNTFAISLLEGFNKWAKCGLKAFITSDLRHFTLPDSLGGNMNYNEHNLSIGAQLIKAQGKALHYEATAETWMVGEDAGQIKIDAKADFNFPLFNDTVTLAASGFLHHLNPTFYYRHYHARHYWWDNNDLSNIIHSRIEGRFEYDKTRTTLRVAFDEIKNLTYFAQSYHIDDDFLRKSNVVTPRQCSSPISLFTASLEQYIKWGPLCWESIVTWQKSTNEDVLPVPTLNIYTNLYFHFTYAKVLNFDIGSDLRYFTSFYAPDYSPALGQYTVQEGKSSIKTGNYPIINVYANMHLKHTRFFIMLSHVNAGSGKRNYFLTPHYPLNDRTLRFGVSWNFFN